MGAWVKEYRGLIGERLAAGRDPLTQAIMSSMDDPMKKPSPVVKPFAALDQGDVLLVAPPDGYWPGDLASKGLKFVDKLTSWEWGEGSSKASHTLMYLKTVNGQKLFLDDQLGQGPRIKTEEMVLREYAGRSMDVAQPVAKIDADKLWAAARQLEVQNLAHLDRSLVGASTYNLYGDDHMVCSEASRWALVQAWRRSRTTSSGTPLRRSRRCWASTSVRRTSTPTGSTSSYRAWTCPSSPRLLDFHTSPSFRRARSP